MAMDIKSAKDAVRGFLGHAETAKGYVFKSTRDPKAAAAKTSLMGARLRKTAMTAAVATAVLGGIAGVSPASAHDLRIGVMIGAPGVMPPAVVMAQPIQQPASICIPTTVNVNGELVSGCSYVQPMAPAQIVQPAFVQPGFAVPGVNLVLGGLGGGEHHRRGGGWER